MQLQKVRVRQLALSPPVRKKRNSTKETDVEIQIVDDGESDVNVAVKAARVERAGQLRSSTAGSVPQDPEPESMP